MGKDGQRLFSNSRSPSLHATVEIDAKLGGIGTEFSKPSADSAETRIFANSPNSCSATGDEDA
jgi:hypothetical protein